MKMQEIGMKIEISPNPVRRYSIEKKYAAIADMRLIIEKLSFLNSFATMFVNFLAGS